MSMALSLVYLPDSVLLKILSNLYAVDLYNLLSVHPRLAQLVEDKSLWQHINFGPYPLSPQYTRKFIRFLGPKTQSLAITGYVKSVVRPHPKSFQCISEAFFLSLKRRCPNLHELKLNKCYIDASNTKFSCLPSSLKRIYLSGSAIVNLPQIRSRLNSPFFRLEKHFPQLEQVHLTDCKSWLTHTDVALIMKCCTNLKTIIIGTMYYSRNGRNSWLKHELGSSS